jgi:ABC-type branched-subunit amino acid transport system substrate-binding protein
VLVSPDGAIGIGNRLRRLGSRAFARHSFARPRGQAGGAPPIDRQRKSRAPPSHPMRSGSDNTYADDSLLTRLLGLAAAIAVGSSPDLASDARAQIRLGGLTTLEGPFATGGQDAYRCVQMELERINYTVGGRRIEFIRESSNAQADVALARARKLIEQDKVDIILGPLSGAEGIALRDYSRTLTGKTIVNGSSGAADTTLRNPSPNFFRFSTRRRAVDGRARPARLQRP